MKVVRSLYDSAPAKNKTETSRIKDARERVMAFRRRKALKAKLADAREKAKARLKERKIADMEARIDRLDRLVSRSSTRARVVPRRVVEDEGRVVTRRVARRPLRTTRVVEDEGRVVTRRVARRPLRTTRVVEDESPRRRAVRRVVRRVVQR